MKVENVCKKAGLEAEYMNLMASTSVFMNKLKGLSFGEALSQFGMIDHLRMDLVDKLSKKMTDGIITEEEFREAREDLIKIIENLKEAMIRRFR
jgi:hypothetical protein